MAGKRKKASRQRLTPRLSFAAPAQPEKDGSQKWRRSGTGGTSESTKTNASLATEYLDHFLKLKCHEFTVATSEEFGHIICDISLIQEFATFMSEAARTKKTGELVAPGTAKTLFNAAVNVLRKRHPKNELWNVHTEDWYTAIVRDVEVTTSKRRILVGLPVHEKSEGIGREVLCRMMQASLSVAPNKQLQAIKDRIALVTTFLAIGRSGEVGFTSYNLSKWNSIYECINLEWPNLKRSEQQPLSPTVVRYTCKTSALDIAALYHAAFTVGTVVDHIDKRERQRVHAVVKNAATLLRTSTESRLLDISRRLQTAPVSTTSSAWEGWNRIHTQASVELKDIVMKLMQPDVKVGDAAYKPTVCAVGSRLLKQGV